MSLAAARAARPASCRHCGEPTGDPARTFCCSGCEAVFDLLHERGLDRYYDLGGGAGAPVGEPPVVESRTWLEPITARLAAEPGVARVELDVQGVHCAACVWLIDELFRRQPGGAAIELNPARGSVALTVAPSFPLGPFVADVERFGYRFGPALKRGAQGGGDLLIRAVVVLALAGNAMMFSTAIYLGLADGPLRRLFDLLLLALATLAVAIGGPVFFRSALGALRRGVLHLDLPIALGIALAYGGSLWAALIGNTEGSYLDTVTVFVALMLLGRWLQRRVVEQNQDRLLASEGAEGLLCRRLIADRVEIGPATAVTAGDRLLIAPGDVVPVEAALDAPVASLALDWVTGESAPRTFTRGERVPAGAFNLDRRAAIVVAAEAFSSSRLVALLGARRDDAGGPHTARLARAISGWYVGAVLVAAGIGAAGWWLATGDPTRALTVATSVLVITCPCAFGIAAPLAWELTLVGLRRAGLFVRRPSFLDRARDIRRVVFDKTGTLTTGIPELVAPERLAGLAAADRAALYDLAARSSHPRSVAVARAMPGARLRAEIDVEELPGRGLAATVDGRRYRLGAPAWVAADGNDGAAPTPAPGDAARPLAFGKGGVILLELDTREAARRGAADELARLRAAGHELWILSGDHPLRVATLAAALELPAERALGGCSPDDKAAFLRAHDRGDTLFLGDGVNDALAVRTAHASGTPAIDRPFMAALTDFYLVTPGLAPIALALAAAAALGRVLRRNFVLAVAYNVLGVGLAWAGLLGPLAAALLMPASSIAIVLLTTWSLSSRSPLWKPSTSSSS